MSEAMMTTASRFVPSTLAKPYPALPGWFNDKLDDWPFYIVVRSVGGPEEARQATRNQVRQSIFELAHDLAGPDPTPLVWRLATTAALAYAMMKQAEATAYDDPDGASLRLREHRLKMLNLHTRRFASLAKTLEAVRKAGKPTVQVVNVGGQNQVNVGGQADR